jgi:hypothetical protein
MEVWTFINKISNKIIRCDTLSSDVEFGNLYYFIECDFSPYWFVDSEEKALLAYNSGFVHEQYCNNFERPITERINLDDYKITKFVNVITHNEL